MHVYRDIDHLPVFERSVITTGTFDGVHSGHVHVLNQLKEEAQKINGTPVVITFFPHPRQVLYSGGNPVYLLNTPEEKYALLYKNGIHHIVEIPFSREFSDQPPLEYIENFLVKKFRPHTIIIGYDHKFGRNREGDYHLLEAVSKQAGYIVKEIHEQILQDVVISSTRIREALLAGDIETANKFLGYEYMFSGNIIQGKQLGRTIGFPTANIEISEKEKLIPANGVYAVKVSLNDSEILYKGMMNIGLRPTVDGTVRTIEVHLFNFNEQAYGKKITVNIFKRLRSEIKFNSLDELKIQLEKDKVTAISAFS